MFSHLSASSIKKKATDKIPQAMGCRVNNVDMRGFLSLQVRVLPEKNTLENMAINCAVEAGSKIGEEMALKMFFYI